MRRVFTLPRLLVCAALGVTSGIYIWKPVFEEQARSRGPHQEPPPRAPGQQS